MLITRYLAPPTRTMLREAGVGYADATGNLYLMLAVPALYLADRGADKDPWRGAGRPRGTLKGEPAARVVRALLDTDRSWRVRDLISASGASTGATYRVLEYLNDQELAARDERGAWSVPNWERLLRAWAEDWNYLTETTVRRYIHPRGLIRVQAAAAASSLSYAVTGATAAAEWSTVAPQRALSFYTEGAAAAAAEWGLRETDAGANVILLEPRTTRSFVFQNRGRTADGLARVAPAQAAVDLLNGPGRDPAEGEELITWMRGNEASWRI
ncbi:hypothetical protein ET475_05685 [Microbacterium protaetiae]|uniref:HTH iclR-type domain-containing protein n=1 Tax=Microbacterium protaetiae TaxID=2509458 RepID=A0A4P6EBZ7_9MICO|nr:hypothetical protein [Microbacterium protaetiae]QAY59524.1 hypothetical protein ET475_05685 [Microbacterium protaetiae]